MNSIIYSRLCNDSVDFLLPPEQRPFPILCPRSLCSGWRPHVSTNTRKTSYIDGLMRSAWSLLMLWKSRGYLSPQRARSTMHFLKVEYTGPQINSWGLFQGLNPHSIRLAEASLCQKEKLLLLAPPPISFLVLPHRGSQHSSGFLRRTGPFLLLPHHSVNKLLFVSKYKGQILHLTMWSFYLNWKVSLQSANTSLVMDWIQGT